MKKFIAALFILTFTLVFIAYGFRRTQDVFQVSKEGQMVNLEFNVSQHDTLNFVVSPDREGMYNGRPFKGQYIIFTTEDFKSKPFINEYGQLQMSIPRDGFLGRDWWFKYKEYQLHVPSKSKNRS